MPWVSRRSSRKSKLNQKIQYLYAKRNHILTDEYNRMARVLLKDVDLLAIEDLDSKKMRKESLGLNTEQNKAKNRKLAKIKPYEMSQLIKQRANELGKTVVLVDSYKTSQVEYGTEFEEKHDVTAREWTSKYTGKRIKRDLNASRNILAWAINPQKHIKYREILKRKKTSDDKQKISIKPTDLIEIN